MARPKRIDLPYCLYHVHSRTNSGDVAFSDKKDKEKFLYYLGKYLDLLSFRVHAWCLMTNHFHLLIESRERAGLSELMRRLLTAYTVCFNRRHRRHGHLFQGRFKSHVVDKANYFLYVSRYIHLNPYVIKKSVDPVEYKGSSLQYYAHGGEPSFLTTGEILTWFKGSRKKYVRFVIKGLTENTTPVIIEQRYIGGKAFVKRMGKRIAQYEKGEGRASQARNKRGEYVREKEQKKADEIIRTVAGHFGISVEMMKTGRRLKGKGAVARKVLIVLILENIPWTHKQLAEYIGLNGRSAITYHLETVKENKKLNDLINELRRLVN